MAEHVTIYDIAREAEVSIATVSRVLSGSPKVSPATAQRVQAVIDKHQFTPSALARGLYQQRSNTLGIVLPDLLHPYYASLFSAAQIEAARAGYRMVLFSFPRERGVDAVLVEDMLGSRLDGVIIGGGLSGPGLEDVLPQLQRLHQHMPLVMIAAPIQGLSCIYLYADLAESVRQSVNHLATLGHERIAFVGGAAESRLGGERQAAYRAAMEHCCLPVRYRVETGFSAGAGELAALKLMAGETPPTALVAINDLVALGALHALRSLDKRTPEDVAVIGCDNAYFGTYTSPTLTTVELYADQHGQDAVLQLLSAQEGGAPGFTRRREATMVIRESCGMGLGRRNFSQPE